MAKKQQAEAVATDKQQAEAAPAPVAVATVLVEFEGVPDGMVYPRTFAIGDKVEGDLAAVAVREGWAEPVEA